MFSNIKDILVVIESLNKYKVKQQDNILLFKIKINRKTYNIYFFTDKKSNLTILSPIIDLENLEQDDVLDFLYDMLDINTQITPFAIGTLTQNDIPGLSLGNPVVLINSTDIKKMNITSFKKYLKNLEDTLSFVQDKINLYI